MPEWIEAAAKEICGHVHCEWLIEKAAAIIQRHYDAASMCRWCGGNPHEEISDGVFADCKMCGGTGKVVPS